MPMSDKYMVLSNGPVKVPVLAKNGLYQFNVNGQTVQCSESFERLFIYYVFQKESRSMFAEDLQFLMKDKASPLFIDRAYSTFKVLHPVEPLGFEYSFGAIQLQADVENGLSLPIPGYNCDISLQNEELLLGMLVANPYSDVVEKMSDWFKSYCRDYSLDYDKKCKGQQYAFLAKSFLEQHGVDSFTLPVRPKPEVSQSDITKANAFSFLKIVLIITFWVGLVCGCLFGGDKLSNVDGYWGLGMILIVLGFVLFGLPFIFLDKFKGQ